MDYKRLLLYMTGAKACLENGEEITGIHTGYFGRKISDLIIGTDAVIVELQKKVREVESESEIGAGAGPNMEEIVHG